MRSQVRNISPTSWGHSHGIPPCNNLVRVREGLDTLVCQKNFVILQKRKIKEQLINEFSCFFRETNQRKLVYLHLYISNINK